MSRAAPSRTSRTGRRGADRELCSGRAPAHRRGMMHSSELIPVPAPSTFPEPRADQLRLAVAAYLARFKGSSRDHADSDLRCYLAWCTERGPDPLAARRPHLELYLRWMQEVRLFKPSTVSRRFSVTAGFYRTCVIDGVMEHSPAEHVRRPARASRIPDAGVHAPAVRSPAHRRPRVGQPVRLRAGGHAQPAGAADPRSHQRRYQRPWRGTRPPGLAGLRQGQQGGPGPAATGGRPGHGPGDRHPGERADPAQQPRCPDGPARRHPAAPPPGKDAGVRITRPHPHMLRHTYVTTMLDAGVDLRDVQIAARHADPRTTMRYDPARTSTATPTTSSPPSWPSAPDQATASLLRLRLWGTPGIPNSGR